MPASHRPYLYGADLHLYFIYDLLICLVLNINNSKIMYFIQCNVGLLLNYAIQYF